MERRSKIMSEQPEINNNDPDLISLPTVRAAAARIAPYIVKTPIIRMTPSGYWLKAECLQPIGAFKIRGAFNALLGLTDEERRRGVVAHSSGNHAQAVAYAAKELGVSAVIVMPEKSSPVKLAATKSWGAEIHLVDASQRSEKCQSLAQERGLIIVEPFDSAAIMAGTGTIGLEILESHPGVRHVVVPVGGGGLIGGLAATLKQIKPEITVIGVEPELANDAQKSFRSGVLKALTAQDTARTIADGLRVTQVGHLPWTNIRAFVQDIVAVSEDDIKGAMRRIAAEARLFVEPSGAVALAGAIVMGLNPVDTVAIVSGGNVEPSLYASILTGAEHDQQK
jgi:threonine dehydratase